LKVILDAAGSFRAAPYTNAANIKKIIPNIAVNFVKKNIIKTKPVKQKVNAHPQIMVPQVGSLSELNHIKQIYNRIKSEIEKKYKMKLKVNFGTMLEVVRACLTADELAKTAEFFSFGTNDLTQMALGLSRDDSGRFLEAYRKAKIFRANPFLNVQEPVKRLIRRFVDDAVRSNPELKLGVCGAHARDSDSISFFEGLGFEYLSVMPSHVNQTKAAAQTARSKKLSGD